MSEVMDCPGCRRPLANLDVYWTARVAYARQTARIEIAERIHYRFPRPGSGSDNFTVVETTEMVATFSCRHCNAAIEPAELGWHAVPSPYSHGEMVLQADAVAMEEAL